MVKATYNLEDFRSEILSGIGLARTNRFEVDILPPHVLTGTGSYGAISKFTSIYVEQASIPLLNIFVKPFKIFGPTYQRPITSEYGGEGISITMHVDRNYNVRKFFEDWMHKIVDPDTFTVGYPADYTTTVTIRQIDEVNDVTYSVSLIDAFPKNLNLMDINNASSNQTQRLNVLFAYRYWKRDNPTAAVQGLRNELQPQVPVQEVIIPNVDLRRQWNWQTGSLENSPGSDLPPAA